MVLTMETSTSEVFTNLPQIHHLLRGIVSSSQVVDSKHSGLQLERQFKSLSKALGSDMLKRFLWKLTGF